MRVRTFCAISRNFRARIGFPARASCERPPPPTRPAGGSGGTDRAGLLGGIRASARLDLAGPKLGGRGLPGAETTAGPRRPARARQARRAPLLSSRTPHPCRPPQEKGAAPAPAVSEWLLRARGHSPVGGAGRGGAGRGGRRRVEGRGGACCARGGRGGGGVPGEKPAAAAAAARSRPTPRLGAEKSRGEGRGAGQGWGEAGAGSGE